jgi:murein DD-endopeptidase MepM/ murein hydrolase activator NlpD
MRTLAATSCTLLVLASCAPEKPGRVDVVVRIDGVRMDDTTRAMVAALSQQMRSGFELGTRRQASNWGPLAVIGSGPEWTQYLSDVLEQQSWAQAAPAMQVTAIADRSGGPPAHEPFRFRAKDRATRGKIRPLKKGIERQGLASGPLLALRDLMMPVVGISTERLRDSYGDLRSGRRIHGAIDIHAPLGTPVVASVAGTIWKIRSDPGGGRTVHMLDQSGTYVFYYAHLSRYAQGLKEGQVVQRGDVLGYVGRSGDVVGSPHLHLRIGRVPVDREHWWNTTPLNPYPLLKSASTVQP